MKTYNKLVRDKIPEIIEADGGTPHVHVLADDETYLQALVTKLTQEEISEFLASRSPEELADMNEVLRALATAVGSSPEAVEAIRQKKFEERGGFEQRIFLESVD